MFKKIVILGDSFTYGHGCKDRVWFHSKTENKIMGDMAQFKQGPSKFCWPARLAKDFPKTQVINLSMPGLDNQGMLTALLVNPEAYQDADLIIMSTTVADRMLIRDGTLGQWTDFYGLANTVAMDHVLRYGVIASAAHAGTDLLGDLNSRDAFAKFMAFCHHDGRSTQTAWSAVLGVAAIAKTQKAVFAWAPPGYCAASRHNEVIPTSLYRQLTNIHDFVGRTPEYLAEDEHANELGHLVYYKEALLPELKKLYHG